MPNLSTRLYVGLTLLEDQREREESWLVAYGEAAESITGVMLFVWSPWERSDAVQDPLVLRHIAAIKAAGLTLHWGRSLWIRYPGTVFQSEHDMYSAAYYCRLLATINAEAMSINADGTAIDGQPYADSIFRDLFPNGVTRDGLNWMTAAIGEARRVAPGVNIVLPASGQYRNSVYWYLRGLGEEYAHEKSYKLEGPPLNATPPAGMSLDMHHWGTALKSAGSDAPWLTVPEWKAIDWEVIEVAYPLKGRWLWVPRSMLLDVMYELGGRGRRETG